MNLHLLTASVNVKGRRKASGGGMNQVKKEKKTGVGDNKIGERGQAAQGKEWGRISAPVVSGAFHAQMQV